MPSPETQSKWAGDALYCRAVISYLAARSRVNQAATQIEIEAHLRLARRTVSRALKTLGDLVCKKGGKWTAAEPQPGVFLPAQASGKHWSDKLSYCPLRLPKPNSMIAGREFGLRHAIILAMVRQKQAQGVNHFTIAGIATYCQLSRATAFRVIADLQAAHIIIRDGQQIQFISNSDLTPYLVSPPAKPKSDHPTPDYLDVGGTVFFDFTDEQIAAIKPDLIWLFDNVGKTLPDSKWALVQKRKEFNARSAKGELKSMTFFKYLSNCIEWQKKPNARYVTQGKPNTRPNAPPAPPLSLVEAELKATKQFLEGKLGALTESTLKANVGSIAEWAADGKVSPYYLVLSPWVDKQDFPNVNCELYSERVTPESKALFQELCGSVKCAI